MSKFCFNMKFIDIARTAGHSTWIWVIIRCLCVHRLQVSSLLQLELYVHTKPLVNVNWKCDGAPIEVKAPTVVLEGRIERGVFIKAYFLDDGVGVGGEAFLESMDEVTSLVIHW